MDNCALCGKPREKHKLPTSRCGYVAPGIDKKVGTRTFCVTSTIISTVNLPCETVQEAVAYLNDPEKPTVELLESATDLVSDEWDVDSVELAERR